RQLKAEFTEIYKKVDVLIAPTLPVVANDIGDDLVDLNGERVDLINNIIRFTGPGNLTGLPALSVPVGFKGNLPIGLQVIGPAFQEGKVLNVGYAIEQFNLTENRKPNILIANQ